MHRLDLNQLRVLQVLLETGSVTETAARLDSSQAAVSRALQALRTLFGDPLFIKTKDGMVPTKRAEMLIAPLREWTEATNALEGFMDRDGKTGGGEVLGPVPCASE